MNYRQSVLTFLGLLNALPLTAKASSAADTPSQKFAYMIERDSIPASIQEFALSQLNINLQTDEGRRDVYLLLSTLNATPDQSSSEGESDSQAEPDDNEIFDSLKERVGLHHPIIIKQLALMIMTVGKG